jgi:transposase
MAAWLRGVGYSGRQTPAQLMAHLRDAPAGLTGPAEAGCAIVTEQLVTALTDLRKRITALDEAIAEAMTLHHDAAVFTSLPRAGTNRAALLLAEIGDCRARYPDDTALAAAADSRHASPWAADIYNRARARGARHPHAVRILARAWCRVIYRCWIDNNPYDATAHGGAQQLLAAAAG